MIRKRLLLIAAVPCFGAALAVAAAGPEPAAPTAGDLPVVVGDDGSLTCWLSLGPVDPAPPFKAESIRDGARQGAAVWTAVSSPTRQMKLRSQKSGTWFLAVTIRTERPRRLYLSTGADAGLEVQLNGVPRLARPGPRRAQADSDLVPLDLAAGDNLLSLQLSMARGGTSKDRTASAARSTAWPESRTVSVFRVGCTITEPRFVRSGRTRRNASSAFRCLSLRTRTTSGSLAGAGVAVETAPARRSDARTAA